ncbi:MAG: type 1 glutamine amidotransferase [Leptospirales bacterium]|nr:type 1 glutamine amidotransferase [Leptospirales bacterium]
MKRILAFVDDIYEDLELWYPKIRLEEEGWQVDLAGPEIKTYSGKHGYPAKSNVLIKDAVESSYDALLIPGGFMPDKLRRDPSVIELTQAFHKSNKPIAFICHGGWIPISAKILSGKRATGSRGIKDDLENAGAIWIDEAVVVDGNLLSSRTPLDLAAFGRAFVSLIQK